MSEQSDYFRAMAERIEHNAADTFGGACVIVPPEGEPIELLVLDPTADSAQFIGAVQTRLGVALMTLEAELKRGR
jgi:hypothetical protein